jgi:DNA-3-methyladenine glycosylase
MARLSRSFYVRKTERVARDLLGKVLCVRTARGVERARIVETEAYLGAGDRAAHTFGGRRTERVEAMYLGGGHTYVYFIYGMHFCMNLTAGPRDSGQAVLIRAVAPLADGTPPPRAKMRTNGPGKLCARFGITRADNGLDVTAPASRIWVEDAARSRGEKIHRSPRIGIDGAGEARDHLLRFSIEGNPYVSGAKAGKGRKA